jgi:hypothetical protein
VVTILAEKKTPSLVRLKRIEKLLRTINSRFYKASTLEIQATLRPSRISILTVPEATLASHIF